VEPGGRQPAGQLLGSGSRIRSTVAADSREHAWRLLFPPQTRLAADGPSVEAALAASVPVVAIGHGSWPGGPQALDGVAGVALSDPRPAAADTLRKAGFEHQLRFVVLPGRRDPRWLVPAGRTEAAGAMRLYTPYRLPARIAAATARAAARLGLLSMVRPGLLLASREPFPLVERLTELVGPHSLVIHAGRGGRGERLTLAAVRQNGSLAAVARVARSPAGQASVRREATVLRGLAERDDIGAPPLLWEGSVDGALAVVVGPVAGRAPEPRLGPAHDRFLAAAARGPTRSAAQAAILGDMGARAAAVAPADGQLSASLSLVTSGLADRQLPRTVVHGDFAPWNLRLDEGRLWAVDWEHGTLDGLPLLDEIHHELQVGFLLRGWEAEDAAARLATLAATSVYGAATSRALIALALVERVVRALEEDAPPQMVARERALLAAVTADGHRP
jgi:hypothetical protein